MNVLFVYLAVLSLIVGCKTVRQTNAPRKFKNSPANAVQTDNSISKRDVSFEELPQVTVSVDLTDCIGSGRWLDPVKPSSLRLGAVSVTLTRDGNLPAGEAQPNPWLFAPTKNSDDGASDTSKSSYSWRVPVAHYSIEAVAFAVETNILESKISKKIDFSASKDLNIAMIGTWKPNLICELSWK
jgi:hypothetical protein